MNKRLIAVAVALLALSACGSRRQKAVSDALEYDCRGVTRLEVLSTAIDSAAGRLCLTADSVVIELRRPDATTAIVRGYRPSLGASATASASTTSVVERVDSSRVEARAESELTEVREPTAATRVGNWLGVAALCCVGAMIIAASRKIFRSK